MIEAHPYVFGFLMWLIGAVLGACAMAWVQIARDADDFDNPQPPTGVGA